MPSRPDILFAMTGDVHRNARALRQLSALSDAGYTVHVQSLGADGSTSALPAGVTLETVSVSGDGGPRFFLTVHRRFRAAARHVQARLYHASDLYVLSAVKAASTRHGARFSYDARELYAHVAATSGRPFVRSFWRQVEGRSIRRAAQVWTVSESIARHLERTYGIPQPSVQLNAPRVTTRVLPDPYVRDTLGLAPDVPVILHLGQLRRDRGGEVLVRAMRSVEGAHLVFVGYGPAQEMLKALTRNEGLEHRIHFLPPVDPSCVAAVAAGADAGVTLLEDTCLNHRYALPNKLFDYLAAGLPVLASDLPESARIVQLYNVGLTADPSRTDDVSRALRTLVSDTERRAVWARNARAASETIDWGTASQRFLTEIEQLIGPPGTHT